MRILILANNDVGLYQFRYELIQELIKDNEIIISLPYGELVEPLKNIGCRFIDTPVDRRGINPLKDIKLLIKYLKMVHKQKPDMVITYTIKPNIYGGFICKVLNVPYVINITGLGTAFQRDNMLKKIITKMYRVSCRRAKVVFFENEGNRQVFVKENIVSKEKTHTLNGAGVNLEKYQVSEYPKGKKIKFLFMGRIMKEKGVNELFGAMKQLIGDGIECELDVLGGCEEDYKKEINEYERQGWLHYYGYQKDVRPFIDQCHCFVLPSWHEGMANTNLECAASGRPVITSDIFGCKEAIIDKKTGYLVKKQDVNDLYKKMKLFVNLPYEQKEKMGLLGRKHMENNFDKKIIIEETMKSIFDI